MVQWVQRLLGPATPRMLIHPMVVLVVAGVDVRVVAHRVGGLVDNGGVVDRSLVLGVVVLL